MKSVLFAVFLSLFNYGTYGWNGCPDICDQSTCKASTIRCRRDVFVKDDCDCCNVCLRSENEVCGGFHARYGKCDQNLICADQSSEAFIDDQNEEVSKDENDVIGVCQVIKTFYVSFQLTNILNESIILKTSLESPYNIFDVQSGETVKRQLKVFTDNVVTFEAFKNDMKTRMRINGKDVYVLLPDEISDNTFVLDVGNTTKAEAQDCVLSLWSPWSECSVQCGFGTMTRRRDILKEPKNGGKSCPIRLEKKGCFRQNCRDDMVLAQILPADFRRLGSSVYETILPKKKVLTASEKVRQSFRSHCVNFKLMSKHPYCKGTWAESLKLSKPMCVECQPATMNDSGFCRGEGIVGNFTSWMATDAKSCSGLWMRVGDKIPNCKCVDQKFQNFIFV